MAIHGNAPCSCRHHRSSGFSWHVQRNPINSDHLPGLLQILLGEHLTARVADIGLGKTLAGVDVKASSATFLWAAPEQLQVRFWFASTRLDPPWPMILAYCHCKNDKAPVLAPWQNSSCQQARWHRSRAYHRAPVSVSERYRLRPAFKAHAVDPGGQSAKNLPRLATSQTSISNAGPQHIWHPVPNRLGALQSLYSLLSCAGRIE